MLRSVSVSGTAEFSGRKLWSLCEEGCLLQVNTSRGQEGRARGWLLCIYSDLYWTAVLETEQQVKFWQELNGHEVDQSQSGCAQPWLERDNCK